MFLIPLRDHPGLEQDDDSLFMDSVRATRDRGDEESYVFTDRINQRLICLSKFVLVYLNCSLAGSVPAQGSHLVFRVPITLMLQL